MLSENPSQSFKNEWELETAFAKKLVDDTISKMPENLRVEAHRIGYEFLPISDNPEETDAADVMGHYCRSAERIRLYLGHQSTKYRRW